MMDEQRYFINLLKKIQVNVPFLRLKTDYLPLFMEYGMNPEIGIDGDALDSVTDKEFKHIAEILKANERKVTLHGPFMDLVPGGLDNMMLAATRKRLERFFEILPVFDPVNVVCHTGYDPCYYRQHWKEWLTNSVATWKSHVKRAEKFGFKLLLENVYETGPEVHCALLNAVQSDYFGFCFDVGHHNVFGKISLKKWMETLGEKLMELHLHDNNGEEDTHLAVGEGNADFAGLFQFINEKGLSPTITLEPHKEETLWQSLASVDLKEFIRTLS
jgi:sugar phosphate isomerase/epimerase